MKVSRMASISFVEGKWRVLIRRKGFATVSKRFDTKTKAQAWARDMEGKILSGTKTTEVRSKHTIADLIKQYIKLRSGTRPILDTSTEHYTLEQLSRSIGDRVASELTVDDLLGWAQMRKDEGAGPFTINGDLSKLGTVLRYTDATALPVLANARPKLNYLRLIGGGGVRERRPEPEESTLIFEWLVKEKGQ